MSIINIDRIFYLNLFKSFLLSKVGSGSTINITDLENFVVFKGNIVSEEPLNLFKLNEEFNQQCKKLFVDEIKINTIDVLTYKSEENNLKNSELVGIK